MPPKTIETLATPEKKLTTAMLRGIGANTVRATRQDEALNFERLVAAYARDPKEVVAHAREELVAIGQDTDLTPDKKREKLDAYLDAYFDLTVELDHRVFPPTPPGQVHSGVPDYLPDGFIDMGNDANIGPFHRDREQIAVDKQAILKQLKPFMIDLLTRPTGDKPLQKRKEKMVSAIGEHVYSTMQYDHAIADDIKTLGGGKVNLSELSEGVCRHQALVFQVLCQTMGLKSRVLKAKRDGGKHSTNMVRLDKKWYIFDVTNPYRQPQPNGDMKWLPAAYPVDGPPASGQKKTYEVTGKYNGDKHTYEAHDNMHWRIER